MINVILNIFDINFFYKFPNARLGLVKRTKREQSYKTFQKGKYKTGTVPNIKNYSVIKSLENSLKLSFFGI